MRASLIALKPIISTFLIGAHERLPCFHYFKVQINNKGELYIHIHTIGDIFFDSLEVQAFKIDLQKIADLKVVCVMLGMQMYCILTHYERIQLPNASHHTFTPFASMEVEEGQQKKLKELLWPIFINRENEIEI